MNVTFDFEGKNFIVVGASSGMGKKFSVELAESGANILAIGRNLERLEELKKNNPEKIFTVSLDVTKATSENWSATIKNFVESAGKIDGGIYSAGIWGFTPLNSFDDKLAHEIFDTSFWGMINFLQVASKKKFSNSGASFVSISSIEADYGSKGLFAYSAAKSAVQAAVRCIAKEIVTKNKQRINSVAPAMIQTEMMNQYSNSATLNDEMLARHLLGLGQPSDVSGMVLFLLSDKSSWITGQNFIIDGGYVVGSYV